MRLFRLVLLIALIAPAGSAVAGAQGKGSLEMSGRVKIGGKQEKLSRKRFYILKGGLKDNRPLIDRLGAAEIKSRDCYYTEMKASPQFICWLKAENCESPFCRKITQDDIPKVPEFQAAYTKGMTQFKSPDIATDWLTTNLPPIFSNGFYNERRTLTDTLLTGTQPVQSSMTDSVSVKAIFIDIPLVLPAGKATQTFLVSNIVPIELGAKSYLWACEVEIGAEKSAKLNLPEPGKPAKNCEIFVRDLKTCNTESCPEK